MKNREEEFKTQQDNDEKPIAKFKTLFKENKSFKFIFIFGIGMIIFTVCKIVFKF